jgi:hypothetical protein
MSRKVLWFLAAFSLSSGTAAAEQTWVLNADGVYLQQAGKARVAVRLPEWHWAHEPYACPPAIAIGPRGEALVTSNVLPVLWKIDPETLAVTVHSLELDADSDKDVGFSGLVYSARDNAYFAVSELHGTLWRIDPLLRRGQKIALSEPVRGACSISTQREQRVSRFTRLCVQGKAINLAPDQRSAYVQSRGCSSNPFALTPVTIRP